MKTNYLLSLVAIGLAQIAQADVNLGNTKPTTEQIIEILDPTNKTPASHRGDDKDVDDYGSDDEASGVEGGARMIDMKNLNPSKQTSTSPSHSDSTKSVQTASKAPRVKHKRPAESSSFAQESTMTNNSALSMQITFNYNSADLTESAKEQLAPVGKALASNKLQRFVFVVEGHTDGVGGDAYNKALSEARAASVKEFLVNTFNIDSSHIQTVGKGKSELLDPSNPASEVNRRVRIAVVN